MAKPADDLLTMFRLGKKSQQNFGMQISKKKETPGEGGSPYQPYKPKPSGPYAPPPPRPGREGLQIANLADGEADPSIMNYVTVGGFFLDGRGKAYMQTGGKLYDAGEYNPDVHGLPVPLAKNRKKLAIGTA